MKRENDELTGLFRSRLGASQMQVRKGFWEDLEREIPVVVSRRRQLIHRFAAAASVLLVLAGASATLWYFSPKEEIARAFTQVAVSTGTSGQISSDIVRQQLPIVQASTVSPVPSSLKPAAKTEEYPEEGSFSFSFSMSFSVSSSSSSDADSYDGNRSGYSGQNTLAGTSDNGRKQTVSPGSDEAVAASLSKEKLRKWSVGLHGSTALLNGSTAGVLKHKRPFSAGISVRRVLSDHWGIESGLTYTQLSARPVAGDGIYPTLPAQTLHYIGIPVKADYSLYRKDRMNLYASAGGMVEKSVSGSEPLQLSLTAGIGLQYKLNDRLSVYAEPGLSYHFDNGGTALSIRKETPLNINLLCGVRVTY